MRLPVSNIDMPLFNINVVSILVSLKQGITLYL